ncbi:MAG: chromate transporter [Eubacteriales bacterium]|nr:chromate transporter [Eubacteriales bacterium]
MIFLQLFWEFFKTGLFSIGGGLATLPFLKAISLKYPWFTPNDLLDMIAVSESTPGPIGVNTATYAGFHAAGVLGALTATCSLVLPSVVIIILISRALTRFRDSALVKDAFYGLRPASAGLIFGAMLEVFAASLLHMELWGGFSRLTAVLNLPAIAFFLLLSLAIWKLPRLHPILFILIGAVCGVLFQF